MTIFIDKSLLIMSVNTIKYATSSLPHSTLVGSVAFGWVGYDYGPSGVSGWFNGVLPPSGGYVIYATSASQVISATVANNDSDLITISQELTGQAFTSASQSIDYLNANGYAVADQVYTGNYSYSTNVLPWNFDGTNSGSMIALGYTLYTGGFTSADDGYSNIFVSLPINFETNNQSSKNYYLSTNGYFTIGTGDGAIYGNPQNPNPATMAANPGDNWMQPGLVNTDGDIQNWYYQTGSDGGDKHYIKSVVFAGTYGETTSPTSYLINFYKDSGYQWLETRVKLTTRGNAGPYNATDVSQPASTISRVWRGDLNGQNWVYMGTGSVVL